MTPEHEFVHTENKKICSATDIASQLDVFERQIRNMGLSYTCGLVVGCFDLLHPGHIEFLRQAKKITTVPNGINGSDHSIQGIDTLVVGVG